jgi:2,3-bisphosphoglycerate-independent phosphoglycerate mutase
VDRLQLLSQLSIPGATKMVLLVMDGLGGLPDPARGLTELEAARTPNLDALAARSACGLTVPIAPGITPGSGPAHMALFGYEPLRYNIGRGVLSALGVDFPLEKTDLAARLNFCTLDAEGRVTDRRAGRIPTSKGEELCRLLQERVSIEGVQVFVVPEKEYRAVAVFRGGPMSGELGDSDPQETGRPPLAVRPLDDSEAGARSAAIANAFQEQAREILAGQHPANGVLMRGFACRPDLPEFPAVYKVRAAALAVYPMYRGLARLVGMDVLPPQASIADTFATTARLWPQYDFFFLHVKPTDSCGEDGAYERKCQVIEEVDALIPRLLELEPDVLVVTGDHSTPSQLRSHSWHPVPYLLFSPWGRADAAGSFGETACSRGSLGTFPAVENMALMMAHALRLKKFGA